MGIVLRNLSSRILVVFRLAVVVSLIGYTLPNAYAAMHGAAYSDVQMTAVVDRHVDGHSHHAGADHNDRATDHADLGHQGDSSGAAKQMKKDCCQDFCFSIALPSSCHTAGLVTASSVLRVVDDNRVHGIRPNLHRPPNI